MDIFSAFQMMLRDFHRQAPSKTTPKTRAPVEVSSGEWRDHDLTLVVSLVIAHSAADGHVDMSERDRIEFLLSEFQLPERQRRFVLQELEAPRSLETALSEIHSKDCVARALRIIERATDPANPSEVSFLNRCRRLVADCGAS